MDDNKIEYIPRVRIGRLDTVMACSKELQRIYRKFHTGELPSQDLARLANVLNILVGMHRTYDLEARLEELERMIEQRRA